ncbi:MAG TPA: T9SS type A sorting domain-containing protein [Bacteroidia bacterium]|nr:T9SS type A sorting domain-containing protein [Bacteroidia bacterium]
MEEDKSSHTCTTQQPNERGVGKKVYLYNILAKIVQVGRLESEDHIIDIENLANGIYYIKIDSNNGSVKIVKTHN